MGVKGETGSALFEVKKRIYFLFIDKVLLKTVSNHPVHVLDEAGNFLPSSFIPFCYFGDKFIGAKIQEFEIPVCNIFKPKNYLDQLCYETNLQDLKDSQNVGNQLEMGLTLVLDYNEERQNYNININKTQMQSTLYPNNNDVSIHLDTISSFNFNEVFLLKFRIQILLAFLVKVNSIFIV